MGGEAAATAAVEPLIVQAAWDGRVPVSTTLPALYHA